MFVVAILIILIGIGSSAISKVLRSQAKSKTLAEIKLLESACHQYKDRFGLFPEESGNPVNYNFCEYLSNVKPEDIDDYEGVRHMYLDFRKNNINLNNWTALDPYENPYLYQYNHGVIKIWSIGLDGVNNTTDDISN